MALDKVTLNETASHMTVRRRKENGKRGRQENINSVKAKSDEEPLELVHGQNNTEEAKLIGKVPTMTNTKGFVHKTAMVFHLRTKHLWVTVSDKDDNLYSVGPTR